MARETNNIWEDKLNQLAPPDGNAGWKNMELLLDKHKPVYRNKSNRHIRISALLLLLVIGVCNCPFLKKHQDGNLTENKKEITKTPHGAKPLPAEQANEIHLKIQQPENTNQHPIAVNKSRKVNKRIAYSTPLKVQGDEVLSGKRNRSSNDQLPASGPSNSRNSLSVTSIGGKDNNINYDNTIEIFKESLSSSTDPVPSSVTVDKDTLFQSSKNDSVVIVTPPSHQPLNEKIKSKIKTSSLSFGIGINHFIGINNQKPSPINANGGFEDWKNITPVFYIKYHINNKVYLLGEVMINSPQYTNKYLINQKVSFFSFPGTPPIRRRLEENFFTKKLFYVDLPLSFNAGLTKNIFIGSGIQYSHLTQAIVTYESKTLTRGGGIPPDSSVSRSTRSVSKDLKGFNLKENEWRFIANATLKINRLHIGTRYTRSFSSYTTASRIPGISKPYNSSLLFFIRYDFFTVNRK